MTAHSPIRPLDMAAAKVRAAQVLIDEADALLVGYRHYSPHTDHESWCAEDGLAVSAVRDAIDSYHLYITQDVRVPVSFKAGAGR